MTRNLTCIVCPKGCQLTVELEGKKVLSVTGHTCKRGAAYAEAECVAPMRTLTTTAPVSGGGVVPVKTDKAIPKELLFAAMEEVNRLTAPATAKIGDVLVKNLLGTDANLVATANAKKDTL
jgi:CxxC motif-containing protein